MIYTFEYNNDMSQFNVFIKSTIPPSSMRNFLLPDHHSSDNLYHFININMKKYMVFLKKLLDAYITFCLSGITINPIKDSDFGYNIGINTTINLERFQHYFKSEIVSIAEPDASAFEQPAIETPAIVSDETISQLIQDTPVPDTIYHDALSNRAMSDVLDNFTVDERDLLINHLNTTGEIDYFLLFLKKKIPNLNASSLSNVLKHDLRLIKILRDAFVLKISKSTDINNLVNIIKNIQYLDTTENKLIANTFSLYNENFYIKPISKIEKNKYGKLIEPLYRPKYLF